MLSHLQRWMAKTKSDIREIVSSIPRLIKQKVTILLNIIHQMAWTRVQASVDKLNINKKVHAGTELLDFLHQ